VAEHHGAVRPFEELVQEHGTVVMRVCRALLRPADADDAWSETFLSALRAYPRLRPDSDARAWLVTIAHRKAIDQLRAAGRRAVPAGELPVIATEDPPGPDGDLRAALAALSPAQREAVVLHHLGGLPHDEIAAALGISPAAARRRAADGIAALRTRLTGGATP
jgi:DNA-directed RNA polymerase specialized sigma24 family protein